MISASPNRRSENIGIKAVIVAELKLGNVQRHIFSGHFVERARATFEDRPETFNRNGVNSASVKSEVVAAWLNTWTAHRVPCTA
jgi:predicted secreted hydrolase